MLSLTPSAMLHLPLCRLPTPDDLTPTAFDLLFPNFSSLERDFGRSCASA
jgi:hypothetical protein